MTKRKVFLKEVTELDIDGYLLEDIINDLTGLLNKYGTRTRIIKECKHYSDNYYFSVKQPTPETDSEMHIRLAQEEFYKESKERKDREEFQRLSAKFSKEGTQND